MIRKYNNLTWLLTALLVAVNILLLEFSCISSLSEAIAAQKTSQNKVHQAHWGYKADNGPSRWGKLNRDWVLCAEGNHKSPIDLTGAMQEKFDEMKLQFPPAKLTIVHQTHVVDAIDNGHTIQIDYDKGETFEIGNESYELRQFHFHSPSEHTVDGRHYPMEMHLVHSSKDKKLAVIGVFIEEGRKNESFETIWSNLPKKTGQNYC